MFGRILQSDRDADLLDSRHIKLEMINYLK